MPNSLDNLDNINNFSPVPDLIKAIQSGEMVILLDDEQRENEGDLVLAAEKVTPEAINFMVTYGKGLVCMPMSQKRCEQLGLSLMVPESTQKTKFTPSIEAAVGISTGISAEDRAKTVLAAVNKNAKASDLIQPGHIFPIMAEEGGVLSRAGHTEASTDLCQLAGLEPAAVIVEILKDDGTMARRDDLFKMAEKHNLKIGTVADIIKYRIENEQTIECVAKSEIQTEYGHFNLHALLDKLNNQLHFALIKGDLPDLISNQKTNPINIRVHTQDDLSDVFFLEEAQKSWALNNVMKYLEDQSQGIIIYLAKPQSTQKILQRILDLSLSKEFNDSSNKDFDANLRKVGAGARILKSLGVQKMRVLSPPKTYHALSGFGLEVVETYFPNE